MPKRETRMRSFPAIVLACAVLLLPAAASAKDSAARKLGRGAAAVTCGFLEVPGTIHEINRERGATWGWSLGVAEGLGRMVTRHLVGVWELVMAPFPLPKGYAPILEPEFPWDYFQDWD